MKASLWFVACVSCVIGVAGSMPSAQQVHVVDDDGGAGVDFTALQAAVDAAASGDVILVRTGTYGGLQLGTKSLHVVADRGADVRLVTGVVGGGRIHVGDSAACDSIVIQGVEGAPLFGPAATLLRCSGPVWIEDCELTGSSTSATHGVGTESLLAVDSAAVTIIGSTLSGGSFAEDFAGRGMSTSNSTLYAFASTVNGGHGKAAEIFNPLFPALPALPGATGAAIGGSLHAQGSTLRGGDGGAGVLHGGCVSGADGGAGASGTVRLLDSVAVGGTGGAAAPGCSAGAPGPSSIGAGVVSVPGVAHALSVESVFREGDVATFSISGSSGDRVWIGFSFDQSPAFIGALETPRLIDAPPAGMVLGLGVIPIGGTLVRQLNVGTLPAGTEVAYAYAQVLVLDSGGFALGDATFMTLLDASF